jgi:nucleoside-diphosphate-sugar epimerase
VVSTTRPRARTRHRTGPAIAITGAAAGIGRELAIRLAGRDDVGRVVALDASRGDVQGVTWRVLDVRDPGLADRFSGVDVVVHLAIDTGVGGAADARSSLNVRGTQTVLTAAAAAGVRRVVLCTSAMVYGALPDNPVPLEEDGPIRATPDGGVVGDFLEIERLAARSPHAHRGLAVTVVRPATVVGPGVDSVLTRHFEAPRLLVVRGSRPCWQFCHVEDLVSALECAALGAVSGVVTVGCDGWLEQEEVERLSGLRRIELPGSLAFGAAERLYRLGVIPAPPSDLQYVTSPWVVPSSKLREVGWKPAYDNISALQVLLTEVAGHHAVAARRIERREATIAGVGAAGAAVAVMGGAAVVRIVRRRRRGGGGPQ